MFVSDVSDDNPLNLSLRKPPPRQRPDNQPPQTKNFQTPRTLVHHFPPCPISPNFFHQNRHLTSLIAAPAEVRRRDPLYLPPASTSTPITTTASILDEARKLYNQPESPLQATSSISSELLNHSVFLKAFQKEDPGTSLNPPNKVILSDLQMQQLLLKKQVDAFTSSGYPA